MKISPERKILLKRILLVVGIIGFFGFVVFSGHHILAQTPPAADPAPTPAPTGAPVSLAPKDNSTEFTKYIWLAISYILMTIAGWLSILIQIIGNIFVTVVANKSYFSEPFVLVGWGALRDLVNLSFILVLIAIAFMSILRLEQSAVRKLLPKFIAAVLLVNFSFFICQQIIGFADTLTKGFNGEIEGLNSVVFGFIEPFKATQIATGNLEVGDVKIESVISIGIIVLFMFLLMIVYLALTLGMLGRYVVLLMLVVISPLAFLLMILPATAKLSQKFWRQLVSLAFWAPASLFFIWLSLITFKSVGAPFNTIVNGQNIPVLSSSKFTMGDALAFLTTIVFMCMSLYVGKILAGNLGGFTIKAAKAMGGFAKTALTDLTGTTGLGAASAAKYKDYRKNKAAEGAERLNDLITGFNPSATSEERTAARVRATTLKAPWQTGVYTQKRLDKEAAKRKNEHEDAYKRMSSAELDAEAKKLEKGGAGNLEKKEALYRVLAQQGLMESHAGITPENIADKLTAAGFDGDANKAENDGGGAAAKLRNIIAATSQRSDSGDPRLAALLGIKDPSDTKAVGNAVAQQIRERQRKGPGSLKKLKKETFADDQMGAYALSGLEEEIGLDGKPVDFRSQLNPETVRHVDSQFDPKNTDPSYTRRLYEHIAANPNAELNNVDLGTDKNGKKQIANMTKEQADAFKTNIDNIRGITARKKADEQKAEKVLEDSRREEAKQIRQAEREAYEEDRNRSRPTPPPPAAPYTPWSPTP